MPVFCVEAKRHSFCQALASRCVSTARKTCITVPAATDMALTASRHVRVQASCLPLRSERGTREAHGGKVGRRLRKSRKGFTGGSCVGMCTEHCEAAAQWQVCLGLEFAALQANRGCASGQRHGACMLAECVVTSVHEEFKQCSSLDE